MKRVASALSWGMLVVGGLLVLAGLGWGIWVRLNTPPPPIISEAGAVVLAETSAPRPTATQAVPALQPSVPSPSPLPDVKGPTPELLPDWTASLSTPSPTPTQMTTAQPSPTPSSTPTPAPTRPQKAERAPTRIVAPTINMDVPVVSMGWALVDHDGSMKSEWIVPAAAAGWHLNSALPGHGENIVLSGHHNIEGKVFRYVVDLELGDEITLYVDNAPYVYTVTDKYILKETGVSLATRRKNAQWILPSGDERLTLVTCWPYEWPGNSHRVIVVARPPDTTDGNMMGTE